MKTKFTVACVLALLSLAGRAFAQAAPSPVSGVVAQTIDGQVVVQWDSVESDRIDYYRVYYSGESILNNNGLYDDFEVTNGNQTTLGFIPPQGMEDIYVAVIAVATSGLESEYFTEEAYVKVGGSSGPVSSVPDLPTPDAGTPDIPSHTTVKLLKGMATTPEEIVVEFSTSVTVDPERAPEGLHISKANGSTLQIKSITISGKTITIHTAMQERGTVYNVVFAEPFGGKSGQPLDADDRSVFVTGHKDGKDPSAMTTQPTITQPQQNVAQPGAQQAVPPRVSNPMSPPDVVNSTILPQLQPNGAYTVTMEWQVDNAAGDLYGVVVYQTRDGLNFGPPNLLPLDIRGVQLQNVTPGFFGLYVQTVNMYGYVSPGVFQYATLPVYVPGYGFQGDLMFGSMKPGDEPAFDAIEEAPEGMATIDAMTEETPTAPIEGVDHSAAAEAPGIDWQSAGVLAAAVAGAAILFVFLCAMCMKKNGSVKA